MNNFPNKVIKYNNRIGFIDFLSNHKKIIFALIFILSYVLLYFLLDFSSQNLVAHDEGLYARRSRLVEESSNWFSSPFAKAHHKTIGSYWLIALSIKLFGNSELALRLPSIIASFVCIFITYLIASKISNKKSALISVFSLSSMPLWIQYSRYTSPDMLFVLCILLTILFFLKFLDSTQYTNKYFYIFLAGLFISVAFFIRSFMLFFPLFGLTPFIGFHLYRTKNIFKSVFVSGILIGSIPTVISLYFSYQKFGIKGVTSLFDFAKKQAIGGFDFISLLFIPLNYIYLTLPIGILFIILIVVTRSNKNINYPLLIYCYPFLSFFVIVLMSTSYPHYYLFLLPSLSILFGVKLESYSYRFSISRNIIKYLLSLLIISISISLFFVFLYFNNYLIEYYSHNYKLIYILSLFLVLSFIFSIRYLFDNSNYHINLIKFFYNIIITQYISISLLYNFGVIGNPNFKIKSFLNDRHVLLITRSNTIYLYNVDSKIKTLLSYYLPSSKVLKYNDDFRMFNYIITSDQYFLKDFDNKNDFKLIRKFDNHSLLMNISK